MLTIAWLTVLAVVLVFVFGFVAVVVADRREARRIAALTHVAAEHTA
jgi:hypothetical protein